LAKAMASARPIPEDEPVTSATRLSELTRCPFPNQSMSATAA
jgi:hypothetical protein